MSIYEQDSLLSQYLMLHYGRPEDVLPFPDGPHNALNYPARCVHDLLDPGRLPDEARALDVGCAVGRSTFELARFCTSVVGIDRSQRFITAAQTLAASGALDFYRIDEGDLHTSLRFETPAGIPGYRTTFEVGDACALRPDLDAFDVLLNANLIDRLPNPHAFLQRLPSLVRPGGQLLLSSPFTWLEAFTPREYWLGGFELEGRPIHTWDRLTDLLAPHFTLDLSLDLPFLIREHARKYQWSIARAGRWIRNP